MVGKIDSHGTNQICSTNSRPANGHRIAAPSDSMLSTPNLPNAFIGFVMATAFIGFARFSDSRYGSSRSSIVKGKASWVSQVSVLMDACGRAKSTPLVYCIHRPHWEITGITLRAAGFESLRRNLT
jgi:hypothetical protein